MPVKNKRWTIKKKRVVHNDTAHLQAVEINGDIHVLFPGEYLNIKQSDNVAYDRKFIKLKEEYVK